MGIRTVSRCFRFGHDYDPQCMQMDEVLYNCAEDVKNFAAIYLVGGGGGLGFESHRCHFRLILERYPTSTQCMSCMILLQLCSSIGEY